MSLNNDFTEIMKYAHYFNWVPDWVVVQSIYGEFSESHSILTPFAYAYLEELIRSKTSEYGCEILDADGKPKSRSTGMRLVKLAIKENCDNTELVTLLEEIKYHYKVSSSKDSGNNRHSVAHGYMHSKFWNKESFEQLIHEIARLSKHAGF